MGDEKMSFWDDDINFTDEYEVPEQNVIDQAVPINPPTPIPSSDEQAIPQPSVKNPLVYNSIAEKYRITFSTAQNSEEHDAVANMFKAELNARQLTLPNIVSTESGTLLTDNNALLKSLKSGSLSENPEITRSFTDKVEYNLGINLGPFSIANIDSVLTVWESDNGYDLQSDKFGIYRKFRNGIMDADDAYKVSILDGAYDKAVHDAFTELLASNSDVLPKSEVQGKSTTVPPATTSNPSMDIKTDSSYGPGLSDAIKQGLVLDSSGRIVVGSGGNNGSDIVYRSGNIQAQFTGTGNGSWRLVFSSEGNYGNVVLYDENNNVIFSCTATSGRIGETDRSLEDHGPIPLGSYIFDPKEITGGDPKDLSGLGKIIGRNMRGDWGFYRVPLTPQGDIGTNRGGFFLHGGFIPGSAGCIDIGSNDLKLFPLLMQHEGLIKVEVIEGKPNDILFPNSRQKFDV